MAKDEKGRNRSDTVSASTVQRHGTGETLIVKIAPAVVVVFSSRYCIAVASRERRYYRYGLPNVRTRHRPRYDYCGRCSSDASSARRGICKSGIGRVRLSIYQASELIAGREQMAVSYIRRARSVARRTRDHACARPITRSMSRFRIDEWTLFAAGTRAMHRCHTRPNHCDLSRERDCSRMGSAPRSRKLHRRGDRRNAALKSPLRAGRIAPSSCRICADPS